jgi:CAAX protease family protein
MRTPAWYDVWNRFNGHGTYPHQLAFLLLLPLRSLIFSPRQLAERLDLKPNARVLELGPGPGFFSVAIARQIPHENI